MFWAVINSVTSFNDSNYVFIYCEVNAISLIFSIDTNIEAGRHPFVSFGKQQCPIALKMNILKKLPGNALKKII